MKATTKEQNWFAQMRIKNENRRERNGENNTENAKQENRFRAKQYKDRKIMKDKRTMERTNYRKLMENSGSKWSPLYSDLCFAFFRSQICFHIYSFRVFHISVSWWFFTGVSVTASLLWSPGLFTVFWPSSIMLSFGWSPLVANFQVLQSI